MIILVIRFLQADGAEIENESIKIVKNFLLGGETKHGVQDDNASRWEKSSDGF